MRPRRVWERARLEPEAPGKAHEVISGMPDAVEVTCHYGTDVFQLALSLAAYTAMRSWLESAPPGFQRQRRLAGSTAPCSGLRIRRGGLLCALCCGGL